MGLRELISGIREYMPNLEEKDAALLQKAYRVAEGRHEGQTRRSGCPYFVHCFEVAKILVGLRMDLPTICAGLLHDVLEDTGLTSEELKDDFGPEIAFLVEGVTKLSALEFFHVAEEKADNYRKMVLAMARDVRVVLVKLADRLHNMQTIQYMPEAKQKRIARETLEIYAPLAHRLGIALIKTELEDLSFKVVEPDAYREVARLILEKRAEREAYAKSMAEEIRAELDRNGVPARVFGRAKHLYSIARKMHARAVPFESMYDLIGFRVLVETQNECYLALGVLHARWVPMPEQIKDFIASPKSNMYQSLHTVILDRGRPVEVQIRTTDMHHIAEYGIAAHWRYKDTGAGTGVRQAASIEKFAWLRQLLEQIREVRNPSEFLQSMRGELFDEEIFVFTPKGEMKVFPRGATPIDFAFAIHTDIGLHTSGAKVNGRIVPLKSELQNGDTVEILTDDDAHPSRDWLRFVRTSRARTKVKHWFREQDFDQNVQTGRRLLEGEFRQHRRNPRTFLTHALLEAAAAELNHKTVETLLADVGNGQISAQRVYNILVPPEQREQDDEPATPTPAPIAIVDARLGGVENAVTRIAKCCQPVPGDEVVGYVTRGRGVTVHASDCPRIAGEFERIVPIDWYATGKETYVSEIVVESNDRKALLADVAEAIAGAGVNIYRATVHTADAFTAVHHFTLDVAGLEQLQAAMHAISRVRGVRKVTRRHHG
jgi:GTP pyrophosphokinase